ncbi:hypothetical protein AWB74_04891 [Caballeronia arvi]|uniref:Uncharacterized protein n=1 Tax=Caballeronia arvi TaxID=1777135 RepID=A0A158K5S0_9BURK|nr:hypothetical protein AWB74_04891 [Caballeronia arvi]
MPMPSLMTLLDVMCALAPNAMPDWPANRPTPKPTLILLPGSTCGTMVSAVAAATPCRAMVSVCCSACCVWFSWALSELI